jgi:predicted esterase
MSTAKARVLCLHGYAQNAAFFRARTGALRKGLKSVVGDFHFVDGTVAATAEYVQSMGEAGGDRGEALGWWSWEDVNDNGYDGGRVRASTSRLYTGVDETLQRLDEVCDREGPFDGVLGFSQGATVAALLCMRRPHAFRFAVLISGFVPHDPRWAAHFQPEVVALPSLHCFGEADRSVPEERSRLLASSFASAASVQHVHAGGHAIPSDAAFRTAAKDFVAAAMAGGGGAGGGAVGGADVKIKEGTGGGGRTIRTPPPVAPDASSDASGGVAPSAEAEAKFERDYATWRLLARGAH